MTIKSVLAITSLTALIIGIAYLISGFISIYNWFTNFTGGSSTILEDYVPPDPWLGIVLVSIGLVLSASAYYLMRGNTILSIASLLVGSIIAVSTMAIQVIATGTTYLDLLINGEEIEQHQLISGLTRVDAILGYPAILILILSYKIFTLIKAGKFTI